MKKKIILFLSITVALLVGFFVGDITSFITHNSYHEKHLNYHYESSFYINSDNEVHIKSIGICNTVLESKVVKNNFLLTEIEVNYTSPTSYNCPGVNNPVTSTAKLNKTSLITRVYTERSDGVYFFKESESNPDATPKW